MDKKPNTETEETKRTNFFKIVILLADIVVDVFRRFVTHKLPQEQDLYEFLTINQHALYHKWVYNIPCCRSDCDIAIETCQTRKPRICLMHFETMYNTSGHEKEAHEQRENGKVLQHCICKVSVKSGVYVGGLDLSTCFVLLTDFLMISDNEKKWLKCILEQRSGFNRKLNDKSLDSETFGNMWEQIEVPLLLIATEIERSFSETTFIRIKTLSKHTPSAKTFVKSYEKYLEWFSKDDILRRELRYAKQQRNQQLPCSSNLDGGKRVLVITEVIMIDLLNGDDDVETAIERHPPDDGITLERQSPDGMETREKTDDPISQKSEFQDVAISGANSASRDRMDVVITYKNSTDTCTSSNEGNNKAVTRSKSIITQFDSNHESKDEDSKVKMTDEPTTDIGLTAQSQNDTRKELQNDVDKQRLRDATEQIHNQFKTMQNVETDPNKQQPNDTGSDGDSKESNQTGIIADNKNSPKLTADKPKTFEDFYQTVIALEIPGKTRWQNMALIRSLRNHGSELSDEKIKTILFSVESDSLCVHTEIAQELFHSRPTLRESLSEFLHKVFQFCMTNDRFSVNATLKITNPVGIDASLFITETTSIQDTTKFERAKENNVPLITIMEPNTSRESQLLENTQDCVSCKIKDNEICNLYKQMKLLKIAKPRPPIVSKCTQCVLKEKKLFLLEQEKLKVENEVQQKDREISSLQSDIQSKERAMLTYDKLEQTNTLLDKQQIVGNHLIENRIPHLKTYHKSNFYTRPYSEPPEIVTRLPLLPKTVGAYMHVERPITEQVLKKPLHPSVSFTQKKYLSSIRRYNDFLPTKRDAVLRYSYSEPKRRGPFQLPNLPPLYSFSTDKLFRRPISVRGKHMVPEKSESFIGSSKDYPQRRPFQTVGFYFLFLLAVGLNESLGKRNVCLQCDHVPLPQDCTTVVTCRDKEDCFAERFKTQFGTEYYNIGCKPIDVCATGIVGKRRHIVQENLPIVQQRSLPYVSMCHACCQGSSICNVGQLCGAPALNKMNGTICYQCSYNEKPEDCHQITLCKSDEMCFVKQKKSGLSQRTLYESGCAKSSTCFGDSGAYCCAGDLCNNQFECTVKLSNAPKLSKPHIKNGSINFDCSFDFYGKDMSFEVSWTVDGSPLLDYAGNTITSHLHSGERSATLDSDKLAGNLNKMLRCKVVPICTTGLNPDGGIQSNGYWVGMKVTPMLVDHKVIEIVGIESTIPFMCADGTKNNCSPEIILQESRNRTSGCRYKFHRDTQTGNYQVGIVLHLRPHSTLTIKNKLMFYELNNIYFPAWNRYSVPVVHIGVQAKRKHLGNDTITCAIVALEGNSAVQIDVCDQTQIVPVIKYLSPSSHKEIFIDQSEDGLNFKIYLFTGSTIVVNVTGQDLHIELSMLERDVGPPGGICGSSVLEHIPGGEPAESRYLQLWTRTEAEKLFDKDIPFDAHRTVQHGYCNCLSGSEIQCGTEL